MKIISTGLPTSFPITGTITSYNGVATVANGVPAIVAKADQLTQAANVGLTTLYTVPANGAGMYRLIVYTALTQAATTSSTLPNGQVSWTDPDSSGVSNPQFGLTSPLNVLGANGGGSFTFNAKASTTIQYGTTGYASSGATVMQFAVHAKLEYLGS